MIREYVKLQYIGKNNTKFLFYTQQKHFIDKFSFSVD